MFRSLLHTTWRRQLTVAFSVMSIIPILTLGYFVVTYIMPSVVTRENLILTVFLNLFLSFMGLWIVAGLIRSISRFAEKMDRIARGELTGQVEEPLNPELKAMSRAIGTIVEKLSEDRKRLETFNRKLEEKVEEKTAQLSDRNKMLRVELEERKKAERSLMASREELRALAMGLETAREDERKRIEREIHDELGQILTALKMDLSWLKNNIQIDRETISGKVDNMLKIVEGTVGTVRRICAELRPNVLDQLGIVAAIEGLADQFRLRSGIECSVSLPEEKRIGDDQALVLFRCLQEALTNVVKHAEASKVSISLFFENDEAILKVYDNGKGIGGEKTDSRDSPSLGLIGLRERARALNGQFEVASPGGKGTQLKMVLPLKKEDGE